MMKIRTKNTLINFNKIRFDESIKKYGFLYKSIKIFTHLNSSNNNNNKYKILLFGNDEISLPSVEKLYENSKKSDSFIEKLTIITTHSNNKKSTQGTFHKFLNMKSIDRIYIDKNELNNSWNELALKITKQKYNIGLIVSFGLMIPKEIISALEKSCYVMHPSLLPKYRGGAPIQHTLLNKEKQTGITICEASVGKFDAGDILIQKSIDIEVFHRFKELSFVLSNLGAESLLELLSNYDYLTSKKILHIESNRTKAPLIKGEDIYLDFVKDDGEKIITEYKAFFGSQIEPYTKFLLNKEERQLFFENLFIVTKNSGYFTKILQIIDGKATPGSMFWDLKQERNFIFIKSKDCWFASNKIKLNGTGYINAEFFIVKILQNKRFHETNKNEINYKILPNEEKHQIRIEKI